MDASGRSSDENHTAPPTTAAADTHTVADDAQHARAHSVPPVDVDLPVVNVLPSTPPQDAHNANVGPSIAPHRRSTSSPEPGIHAPPSSHPSRSVLRSPSPHGTRDATATAGPSAADHGRFMGSSEPVYPTASTSLPVQVGLPVVNVHPSTPPQHTHHESVDLPVVNVHPSTPPQNTHSATVDSSATHRRQFMSSPEPVHAPRSSHSSTHILRGTSPHGTRDANANAGPSTAEHRRFTSSPEPIPSTSAVGPTTSVVSVPFNTVPVQEPQSIYAITYAPPTHPPPAQIYESRRSSLGLPPPPPPKPIFPAQPVSAQNPSPTRRSHRSMSPRYSGDGHGNGNGSGSGNEPGPSSRPTSIHIQAPLTPREERFANATSPMSLNMVGPYPDAPQRPRLDRARSTNVSSHANHRPELSRRSSAGGAQRATAGMSMMNTFDPVHEDRVSQARSMMESMNTEGVAVMREKTVAERLEPTLTHARDALKQYRLQARATGWSLNFAIGAQVLLGALTTGVAAATSGRQTSIATSVLGGMSTLAASYLAKTRGSGEPEFSAGKCKDLENFERELSAYVLDHGHYVGDKYNGTIQRYRDKFEEIMGSQPTGITQFIKEGVAHLGHQAEARFLPEGVHILPQHHPDAAHAQMQMGGQGGGLQQQPMQMHPQMVSAPHVVQPQMSYAGHIV